MTRRRSDRALVAALVMTIFVLFGTIAVVISVQLDHDRALREQAVRNGQLSAEIKTAVKQMRTIIDQSKPCLEGDNPESPGCKRAKAVENLITDTVNRINEALTKQIESHDAQTHSEHTAISNRVGTRTPITTPTTVARTTPPATLSPLATPSPTAAPSPSTTTTTCPTNGSGKCKK